MSSPQKKKQNFVTFPKNRSSSLQQLGCYGKLLAWKCQGTDLKPTVYRCSPMFSSCSKAVVVFAFVRHFSLSISGFAVSFAVIPRSPSILLFLFRGHGCAETHR